MASHRERRQPKRIDKFLTFRKIWSNYLVSRKMVHSAMVASIAGPMVTRTLPSSQLNILYLILMILIPMMLFRRERPKKKERPRNSQARAGRSMFEEPAPFQRPRPEAPQSGLEGRFQKAHTDALSRRGGARHDLNRWEESVKVGDKLLERLDSWKEVRFGFRSARFGFRSRWTLILFRRVLILFQRILNSFHASWRLERGAAWTRASACGVAKWQFLERPGLWAGAIL
jgi:hypothetical protein